MYSQRTPRFSVRRRVILKSSLTKKAHSLKISLRNRESLVDVSSHLPSCTSVKSSIQYCAPAVFTDPFIQYSRFVVLVRAAVTPAGAALRKPGSSAAKFATLPKGLTVVVALALLPIVMVGYG